MTADPGHMADHFRLGTRGSPLAIAQAKMVKQALEEAHGWRNVEIVSFRTTGDRVTDRPLAELGGKALWTRELDGALLDGRVDACVHSMKDVETIRPERIALAAMLPRADVRERLVGAPSLAALPPNAIVGTSSPRRAAQVRHIRPDVRIVAIRGNVATRLAKLACGEVDATLLAAAGLDRLGEASVGAPISCDMMLPSAGQGAIGIETLADGMARSLVAAIDHRQTSLCVGAERRFLAHLGAGCRSPIAALATIGDGRVKLRAELFSEDGVERVAGNLVASPDAYAPEALAEELLSRASRTMLAGFSPRTGGFAADPAPLAPVSSEWALRPFSTPFPDGDQHR